MTDDITYTPADLDVLDRFLVEYRRSARPDEVLDRYTVRHPELSDEFRHQAGFSLIDPAANLPEIPDVTLLREVAQGRAGVLYEGWQETLDRPVAVKLCRVAEAGVRRGQFLQRYRALARLHHSSILPVHAAGRSGPWLYAVMPLIDGPNLDDLIRRARARLQAGGVGLPSLGDLITGPIDAPFGLEHDAPIRPGLSYLRSAAEIVAAAAQAIDYAHREGVWHLELSASKLMLDVTGRCWVLGFGGSRRREAGEREAADRSTATRTGGVTDARTDVHALGTILYELIALRPPAPSKAPAAGPVSLTRLVRGLPRDLEAITMKAGASRPDDRYQTAEALAADLRCWLGGRQTRARPWSLVARLRNALRVVQPS